MLDLARIKADNEERKKLEAALPPGTVVNHNPAPEDVRTIRCPGHDGITLFTVPFGSNDDADFVAYCYNHPASATIDALVAELERVQGELSVLKNETCEHDWHERDEDIGEGREIVVCLLCGVRGERTIATGDVYCPAT